jgi:hypothetical protein
MATNNEGVRLSLIISPELNQRLELLASSGHISKTEILCRSIALYDLVAKAKIEKKRLGFFDQNKHLLTEIVGL